MTTKTTTRKIPTTKSLHRIRDGNSGDEKPQHDPWETYHLVLAAVLIAGVVASCHGLLDLLQHVYRMNELEQSGLGAAMVVLLRGLTKAFQQSLSALVKAIAWLLQRLR